MTEPDQTPLPNAALFDHKRFVALREALLERLDRNAPAADVDAQLDKLLQHLQRQFAAEEQQMQAVQFPPYAAHKREHERALADLAEQRAAWRERRSREQLLAYLENGLADWFVKHVNTRDFITARFISDPAVRRSPLTSPARD